MNLSTFDNIYLDLIFEEVAQAKLDETIANCESLVNNFLNNPKSKTALEDLQNFFKTDSLIKDLQDEAEVTNNDFKNCVTSGNESSKEVTEDGEDLEESGLNKQQIKELEKIIAKRLKSKKSKKSKKSDGFFEKAIEKIETAKKVAKLIFWVSLIGASIYGYKCLGTKDPTDMAGYIGQYKNSYNADTASTLKQLQGVYLGVDATATGIRQPIESLKEVSKHARMKNECEKFEKSDAENFDSVTYKPEEHNAVRNFMHGMTHPTEMLAYPKK